MIIDERIKVGVLTLVAVAGLAWDGGCSSDGPEESAAKAKEARVMIFNFRNALDMFKVDVGRYPTTDEGLNALKEKPATAAKWAGPYIREDIPADPWGNAFLYRSVGEDGAEWEILSLGADGAPGGNGAAMDVRDSG